MSVDFILGDALETLASMPEASVDAVCTDPPYVSTSLEWDQWPHGWPQAVARVLKPGGSMWVFGSMRMFIDRRDEFEGWKIAQDIVWEKHNRSSFHNDRFRRVHEHAVQFYRGAWADVYKGIVTTNDARKRMMRRKGGPTHLGDIADSTYTREDGGPRIMRSVIYARSQNGQAIHPTQKPEAIVEPLIINACPVGGVVLDPFAGSGTTGYVAQRLGRSAILIEKYTPHFEAMRRRFTDDLFTADI